ncbi:MAG: MEDS domain-containing protein [Actinobacteria bacterium]|nr:MEDS domain-containing protein [Actinomycetota bacterium]
MSRTATDRASTQAHDHVVGFYETDAHLAGAVAAFLAPAFGPDAAAIVIATPEHRHLIAQALLERGISVNDADHYVALDAADLLDSFTSAGSPNADRFDDVIGGLIERHTSVGRRVYAFGEMVAIAWDRREVTVALQLEELWNRLGETLPFALFCGYPTSAFSGPVEVDAFRRVVDAHTAVVPSESLTGLTGAAEQPETVRLLQQQAIVGSNERDALRRKQAQLEDALDRLREADRLRREFMAMVVHDVQTPATIISGMLSLLEESLTELNEDQIRQQLGAALRSADQIRRLLDDLLLVSRLEAGTFTYRIAPVDLRALVDEVVAQVRSGTGRRIDVEVSQDTPLVSADAGRQVQVLNNLLSNAIKFSSPETPVRIDVTVPGDEVRVEVTDAGRGIAAEDLPALFRPFSRVGDAAGHTAGTGLGLYITKALVEGQGGSIDVRSQPGTGTTFTYTVPVSSGSH